MLTRLFFALSLILTIALVACGGGDEPADSEPGDDASAGPAAAEGPRRAASQNLAASGRPVVQVEVRVEGERVDVLSGLVVCDDDIVTVLGEVPLLVEHHHLEMLPEIRVFHPLRDAHPVDEIADRSRHSCCAALPIAGAAAPRAPRRARRRWRGRFGRRRRAAEIGRASCRERV